jgi:hypothetical protein
MASWQEYVESAAKVAPPPRFHLAASRSLEPNGGDCGVKHLGGEKVAHVDAHAAVNRIVRPGGLSSRRRAISLTRPGTDCAAVATGGAR